MKRIKFDDMDYKQYNDLFSKGINGLSLLILIFILALLIKL